MLQLKVDIIYFVEMYGPQFMMGGNKPRGNGSAPVGGSNKMRMANQYSPPGISLFCW